MQDQLLAAAQARKASDDDWEGRLNAAISSAEQWRDFGDARAAELASLERQLQVRLPALMQPASCMRA